jgi:DNA mismatch repair protein MutS2
VYFESAKFARDSVRKTSRALGQSSDSSSRFEKGVDAYTNGLGMSRALHLIEELGVGTVTNVSRDICAVSLAPRTMEMRVEKINALLGIEVPETEILAILDRLQFKPEIDIRGMRADEALQTITYFIDDAMMVGISRVRILHGTGNGILRQLTRNYLAGIKGIRFFDEHVQFGGAGITIIEF